MLPHPLNNCARPFPVLSPAQRYHLDVNGYVVVPNTLKDEEVTSLREALYRLRGELRATADPMKSRVRGARLAKDLPHHVVMGPLLEADPAFTAYATNPKMVSLAEELIGGDARIVETNTHINRRDPKTWREQPRYSFHRGTDVPFGSHTKNGLYHCNFVKTLTNLTDLGPDDGGTVVVAGSHKIDLPTEAIMACAEADPKLIHQVLAPAGSTLLFSETLIHATGQIRSETERMIVITGYCTSLFPYWDPPMSSEFKQHIPKQLEILFNGKAHWTRGPKYRTLVDAEDRKT